MVAQIVLILLVIAVFIYVFFIRPWHLRWGAWDDELLTEFPGDDLVQKPDFNATRCISIKASPSEIWRWLIQIGSKRAGWYSYDWIDNGGIKSAKTILPEFQHIAPDQFIPFTPDKKNGMWVREFKESEYILWTDKKGKATWLWYLKPTGESQTRLISKLRTKYTWKSIWIIYYLIYDIGDIIMMTKCLKGIKKRAEINS